MKCLALHSGGLDSTLAIRIIQAQRIEVETVRFFSVFDAGLTDEAIMATALRTAERLGVPVRRVNISDDLLALVKSPPHGHGSHLNPCIDCHAMMVRKAAAMMKDAGASFLITGEVLGERPMSQRRQALDIVARSAGVEGLLLRPLCAKLLDPTIPEKEGWVDREKLYDIRGRGRKPQFALAKQFGITDYPTPAGGCLLTDPGYSGRLAGLLKDQPDCNSEDARLLKAGRYFRFGPNVRMVVARNDKENLALEAVALPQDLMLDAVDVLGPLVLVRGPASEEEVRSAAAITAYYGRGAQRPTVRIKLWRRGAPQEAREVDAVPATEETVVALRVAGDDSGRGRRGE